MKETFKIFLNRLQTELGSLPYRSQLTFGASCCERAYPNYVVFSRLANWGDADHIRRAIDAVWRISVETGGQADLACLEEACKSVTPDLEDFSAPDIDVYAAAAQEAAFMATLLVELAKDKNPSYAARIASLARDTIDMYVQVVESLDPTDPDLETKIECHPLMLAELNKQQEDLTMLKTMQEPGDLPLFHELASKVERSNIGLDLSAL